jgi:hypothetical protein
LLMLSELTLSSMPALATTAVLSLSKGGSRALAVLRQAQHFGVVR